MHLYVSHPFCIWMYGSHSDVYTLMYYDSCYDVLYVCIGCSMMTLYIVHVHNHTARQQGVSSSLQTSNLFAMTKTHHIAFLVQDKRLQQAVEFQMKRAECRLIYIYPNALSRMYIRVTNIIIFNVECENGSQTFKCKVHIRMNWHAFKYSMYIRIFRMTNIHPNKNVHQNVSQNRGLEFWHSDHPP